MTYPLFRNVSLAALYLAAEEEDAKAAPARDEYACAVCGRSLRRGRHLIVKHCKVEGCPEK